MVKEKSKSYFIFVIVAIILVLTTYFLTSYYTKNSQEQNIIFFKEYSIALNNINIALGDLSLAIGNLDTGNYYIQTKEYYYDSAVIYYDVGKEQVLDAKELINKAKTKLQTLKDNAPNSFFQEDVNNRIEQTDALILVGNSLYSLLDYERQQLYEINYGSETKATEYYNKYTALIPLYNNHLKILSDVQNKIDLYWDQDWYVTFQETSSI